MICYNSVKEGAIKKSIMLRQMFCMYCSNANDGSGRIMRFTCYCRFCGNAYCCYHSVDLSPKKYKTEKSRDWSQYTTKSLMSTYCKACKNDDVQNV